MTRRIAISVVGLLAIMSLLITGCPAQPTTFALTTRVDPPGSGTATFTGTSPFDPGAVIPVVATANPGFEFFRWSATAGGFADPLLRSTTFTMPREAATITAHFRELRADGFWLDQITLTRQPHHPTAIAMLEAGALDMFAHGLIDTTLYERVTDDPNLWYKENYGSFNTLRINPFGPVFEDRTLNPFFLFNFTDPGTRTLQEVLNKFIDREHIASILLGGRALPKFVQLNPAFADYAMYAHLIPDIEEEYDFDPVAGWVWLNHTMAQINATVGGLITWSVYAPDGAFRWHYNATVINIDVSIRNDDHRLLIGDYVVAQLRTMGFKATPHYGGMAATLGAVVNNIPRTRLGDWNLYTGGWIITIPPREEGWRFLSMHSNFWTAGIPAYEFLHVPAYFYDAAWELYWWEFTTYVEREDLFEIALPGHMRYGMFYLVDTLTFGPMRTNVDVAADMAGGISGSWQWANTAHFRGPAPNFTPMFGGHMRIGIHDLLVDPWNPIAGSLAVFDMFPIRATGDLGTVVDTRDGLFRPSRISNGTLTLRSDVQHLIRQSLPWVTVSFAPTITAPPDAWRAWNFTTRRPITVGEALANPAAPWGLTDAEVMRYSVARYPADIFTHPLHDGSTLSFADFLYLWLMTYERGVGNATTNPMWDSAAALALPGTYASLIGMRYTVNPIGEPGVGLKVETWSEYWEFDAENIVTTGFPYYARGFGPWHTLALGVRGERANLMAFGGPKGHPLRFGWINFLDRTEQFDQLLTYLDGIRALAPAAYADATVPYFDFIRDQYALQNAGNFSAEVDTRMDNLRNFADARDHLWVGSGPYYIEDYSFALKWITLRPFEAYPDDPNKWLFLLDPLP